MRSDWIVGFGAFSMLVVLVGLDLAVSMIAHRATVAVRRGRRG